MPKAKDILEEVYDVRISSKGKYHTQVQHLDASGELSSLKSHTIVLFRLCELVDSLEKEVEELKNALTNRTQPNPDTTV